MNKLYLMIAGILLFGSVLAVTTVTQQVTVTVISGEITIYSPVQGFKYLSKTVPLNLILTNLADKITYSVDGKEAITLCNNCDEYGYSRYRRINLNDGTHEVLFEAEFDSDKINQSVSFVVDKREPRIRRIYPRREIFSNGTFGVDLQETNPKELWLNYGNEITGFRAKQLDLESDCEVTSPDSKTCSVDVNMEDYDLQDIEFWFNLSDVTDKIAESAKRAMKVDVSNPVLNSINTTVNRGRVYFSLNITEPNTESVEYYDYNSTSPNWIRLCRGLTPEGLCEKRRNFMEGQHLIGIRITDMAGNSITENTEIDV